MNFNEKDEPQLFIEVCEGEESSKEVYRPETYFSTAQLNTVAFSSFFGRALSTNNLPVKTICIDDPIGHFDDMNHFELHSEYKPTGDQPQAIEKLVKGFKEGNQFETLLGVTGSGKTFTMANVIARLNKPTLVLAHNKTLAAQLYGEIEGILP